MMNSMTGYASSFAESNSFRIHLDLKTVNHRFLDIQFKMPEEYRQVEQQLRALITQSITRGKVECRIQIQQKGYASKNLSINQDMVDHLSSINTKILKSHSKIKPMNVADILNFPGILDWDMPEDDDIQTIISTLLKDALTDLITTRRREGERLSDHLLERLYKMEEIIGQLSAYFPELLQQHLNKTKQRLRDALTHIDEDRLKQEFALFMQKSDVDEEFSRLRAHIDEVRRITLSTKPAAKGKRLDFLMQELNREANTLGSKAIAIECTQASVELKVLIEQMREQIQNIE